MGLIYLFIVILGREKNVIKSNKYGCIMFTKLAVKEVLHHQPSILMLNSHNHDVMSTYSLAIRQSLFKQFEMSK